MPGVGVVRVELEGAAELGLGLVDHAQVEVRRRRAQVVAALGQRHRRQLGEGRASLLVAVADPHQRLGLEQDRVDDVVLLLGALQRLVAQAQRLLGVLLVGVGLEVRLGGVEQRGHVLRVDLEEPPPAWALSQDEFEAIAEAALAELPERIRAHLENVPILAADYPAVEIVAEGADPRMMGFFSGVPYPEKSNIAGAVPHLDCVFLYKRSIERASRTREEVTREVRTTLLHETGHFFGLSEEELEEMGLG